MKSRHGTKKKKKKGRKYNPKSCLTRFFLGHFKFFAWKQIPGRQGLGAQVLEMKSIFLFSVVSSRSAPQFTWHFLIAAWLLLTLRNFHRRGLQLKTRQFLLHQSSWSNMFQLSHRLHQGLFLPSSCLLSTHLQNSALHFVCMLPGSYCVMFLTSQCCPVSTGHQCLSAQGWVFPCWKTSWTTAHHVLWLLGGKTTLCTDSDFRNVLEIIHIFPICRCCGNYIPAGSAAQWVRD